MAVMAESEVTRLFGTGASIDPFSVDKCIGRRITEVDLANQAFPGRIICASGAESPAVYVITNLVGSGPTSEPSFLLPRLSPRISEKSRSFAA